SPRRFRRFPWWSGIAAFLVLAGAGIYRVSIAPKGEMIAVVPARWFSQEPGDLDKLDEDLAETIAAELANKRAARVIAWPSVLRYKVERKEIREMGAELGAAQALIVAVRGENGGNRVTLYFVNAASGQKMWVGEYFRKSLAAVEDRREL